MRGKTSVLLGLVQFVLSQKNFVDHQPPSAKDCPLEGYHGNLVVFFVGAAHSATTTTDQIGEILGLYVRKLLGDFWTAHRWSQKFRPQDNVWKVTAKYFRGHFRNTTGLSTVEYSRWNRMEKYGSLPDIDVLSSCFPKSLFILNARPLLPYMVTKAMWNGIADRDIKNALCKENILDYKFSQGSETLDTKLRRLILVREWYHIRVIDFFVQHAQLQHRFFAIDATSAADQTQDVFRLCLVLYSLDSGHGRILHKLKDASPKRPTALLPGSSAAHPNACHAFYSPSSSSSSSKAAPTRHIHRHVSPDASTTASKRLCLAAHINATGERLGLTPYDMGQSFLVFPTSRTRTRMALLFKALSFPSFKQ